MHLKECRSLMLAVISLLTLYAVVFAAPSQKVKDLARQIKKDLRTVENSHDSSKTRALLDEIRKKIDELKAEDPSYPELRTIESSYRRNRGMYGDDTATGKNNKPEDSAAKKQALQDWQDIVDTYNAFRKKLDTVIPHGKSVIYENSDIDRVMTEINSIRREVPAIKKKIDTFTSKYGNDIDTIDIKMAELTPLDTKAGRYSEENRRPDESAGLAVDRMIMRMADLESAPAFMARMVMGNAIRNMSDIESFPDTSRDARYSEVENELSIAAKLDPKNPDVKVWQGKVRKIKSASRKNAEKELENARFPSDIKNFSGPGNPSELKKSIMAFYDSLYPGEKSVAVSIAGNWSSVKKNILGETIQWGLPVNIAAHRKDNPDICRVFNLTMVTKEARGIKKSPPWDAEWVGNSYRMKTSNVPGK